MRTAEIKADRQLRRTWNSWRAMHGRCGNPKNNAYSRYGARGIKVCAQWSIFETFLSDMGLRPEDMTLDRYPDQRGNYEPRNCRWATGQQQIANRSFKEGTAKGPNAVLLAFDGRTQSVNQWRLELGLGKNTIHRRLRYGWSVEQALTTPAHKRPVDLPMAGVAA